MEVSMAQYPPGDPRLVDKIVGQLKSQGIFDRFRKECIADVDTKPAYQNLHQRVETSVSAFLAQQEWKSDLNKNQVRDSLRKHIHESGFLDIGVERIVDQVVNPKIMPVFLPQIEDVVYSCLGIEKPKKNKENFNVTMCPPPIKQPPEKKPEPLQVLSEMLPKDLDPISPESDTFKDDDDNDNDDDNCDDELYNNDDDDDELDNNDDYDDNDGLDKSKVTEEEESSPPFEPIEGIHSHHDSNASHLSDISGLSSENSQISEISFSDSKRGVSTPKCPVADLVSQDSQLSKVSSNSRLSMEFSDELKEPCKIPPDDNREGAFSHISEDSSKQKYEGVTSFSQQHNFGHLADMEEEHEDKSKEVLINEELLKNRYLQSNTDSNVNKLQKCEFDFADSASMQTEETAKSSIDESDSKSHLYTGMESCDASETDLSAAKLESKTTIFSSIFKENKSENLDNHINKSGNDCSGDNNLKCNNESLNVCEQNSILEKHTDGIVADNFCKISCNKGSATASTLSGIKQKNMIFTNSTCINFKNEETESPMLKDNSLDGYGKITEHIDDKSDTQCETDTDTKDSQSLHGTHHYNSIEESFNTYDSQHQIGNFKDHEEEDKNIVSMDGVTGDEVKQYFKEGHSMKQIKYETATKKYTDMSHQKGSSHEEMSARNEGMKESFREQGKKEYSKDNSQTDRHTKDGTKERSRSEKEITKDRNRHDRLTKDNGKEHSKHDDRKVKEGSKDYSKRDDSRERTKQSERKERSKRDDKSEKEISKDKYKHEEKSDRERSRHDSKYEKEKVRDHSRHDEKSDRHANKDRKEGSKESSRRDKTREKDDKTTKISDKDKGKQEEKSDKYKTKIDERSKCEKEKTRNENSSSKPTSQDAEQKEKYKSDSKRSKDKHKHDKSKHASDGKPRKSSDDKPEKEISNKEDQKDKLKDQAKIDSGENAEKSHKDKQRINEKNEKDRKSQDKSRESSCSSSSRKSDRKGENSKSQKNESKDKEKKKENKSKTAPDDHFVHRDKNSEDRRSTDRDSNGTSCDKSRGKGTESQSSQKQEKKNSRNSGSGKTEGGVSESPDTNAKSEECNEGGSPSKSPESSPPSLLPLKKRPLHQHSETDDEFDEYSCSSDSGKLVLKLKKPKIAANIFEIKKIMQLRKSMAKIENRNRYHNGKHSEIKEQTEKQQNDTDILIMAGDNQRGLQSSDSVDYPVSEYGDALINDKDKVAAKEGVSLPSEETILQNVKQSTDMYTRKECVSGNSTKAEEEDSPNGDSDYENSDVDGELTHFEQASTPQTEFFSSYIRTYEENLYSNLVCFTDCSDSDNEETSVTHSLSHLKCKVVKEIIDGYVRQHFGLDSDLTISVIEASPTFKTLRSEDIAGETKDIPTSSKSSTEKDLLDGMPNKMRTAVDISGTAHYETNRNITENRQSSSELNHAKFHASATTKKLPKGYVLEWVPVTATDIDNSNNNAVHSHRRYCKRNGGNNKEKTTVNIKKEIKTEQKVEECIDKAPPTEGAFERVSVSDPLKEVHEIPHFISGSDNTNAVNCASNNGPDNRYVIADSDEDEYIGDEKYNADNNIDKSSSDDEKVPLSADLIFHSLRDLMLESGMQKQLSPEKVISIPGNSPKPSESRRNLLGRSRRPGLGRPAPGKGVVVENSNSRTSTPDFVMPLSPESDISASSGEQNKKLVDSREAGNIADSDVDTENLNQEDSEGKRTLRSATTAYRGQRYSSDELYKPRPLFNVTSRRAKSKQQPPSPSEEVTVKKRRSTVEGCEASHSEKGTYR